MSSQGTGLYFLQAVLLKERFGDEVSQKVFGRIDGTVQILTRYVHSIICGSLLLSQFFEHDRLNR